jgi:hypothetical protein
MIVARTSGAQKIVWSRQDRPGSVAKNQPPILAELSPDADARLRCCAIALLKSAIAAQALPREPGHFGTFNTIIKVSR